MSQLTVALSLGHFGRHIAPCSSHAAGNILILTLTIDWLEFLSETKVEEFDVTTYVEANVLSSTYYDVRANVSQTNNDTVMHITHRWLDIAMQDSRSAD